MAYKKLDTVVANVDEGGTSGNLFGARTSVQNFDLVAKDRQDIQRKHVDFENYQKNGALSEAAFQFVKDYILYDDATKKCDIVEGRVEQCVEFLKSSLSSIHSQEPLSFVLTMFNDILDHETTRENVLNTMDINGMINLLVNLLEGQDRFCMLMAGLVFGRLVFYTRCQLEKESITMYLKCVVTWLLKLHTDYLICVTEGLKYFLMIPAYRQPYYKMNGVKPLTDILSKKPNFQLQYQVVFCIWMLSFSEDLAVKMKDTQVVVTTADTLRATTREKVRRVVFAFYCNLLKKSPPAIAESYGIQMVTYKVLSVLNVLVKQNFQDEDLQKDVEFLQEYLTDSVNDMSSFDEYSAELKSGRLEWSPVHKSNKFWRENVLKFHEHDYDLLRQLVTIMNETTSTSLAKAVACHDVGEYVHFNPRGKRVLENLGAKEAVLRLIENTESEVRIQALLALQKIMVQNWEYLGKQLMSQQ